MNNNKYKYEEVREIVQGKGFDLVDKEYINCKEKLTLKDNEGYLYSISFNNLIHGENPSMFNSYNSYTIDNIKLWCKLNNPNFELLTKQYVNNKDKLLFKDRDGYLYSLPLKSFLKRRSPITFHVNNEYTLYNINLWLNKNNLPYKLISSYEGYTNKLIFKDNEGYFYLASIGNIINNHLPSRFHISNYYTIQNIKLWCDLNDKSFELISKQYLGNKIKLQWRCLNSNCGEVFENSWDEIYGGNNCPFCSGQRVGLSNCLATKNPELSKEWHPIKNGNLTPWDVTYGSGQKFWWKCKGCSHEWEATVCERNRKDGKSSGCPECSKSKGEKECKKVFLSKNFLEIRQEDYDKISDISDNNLYFIPQKTFEDLVGLKGNLLSYDFYIPKYNLLIEYQGEFHDGTARLQTDDEFIKQKEHDKRKKEYALENDYNFLEIWYWDFDKIREILNRVLNNI